MKFPLSDSALAQHVAILGKTGSGKSSLAKTIVEHLVAQGARVCILDPIKSDWWGLTSSANGKKAGLPFQILGGPRGHVPLHPTSGKVIAELVASGALPLCILDMADFPPGGMAQFFNDFAPTLLRKLKGIVHLVLEEAHEFAPKERAGIGNENMLIHNAKKLATAGRSRGIRMILATQRIQALHNALLGSCDTMVALRLTAPADQKPVVDWLKANLDKDRAVEIAASLSKLKTGSGWVCSGDSENVELVQFQRPWTYDNSATPEAGAPSADEVRTAAVDVDKLRTIIGSAVEEAKANDPAALKAEIAKLRGELAKAPQQASKPVEKSNVVDMKVIETAQRAAWAAGDHNGWERGVREANRAWDSQVALLTFKPIEYVPEVMPSKVLQSTFRQQSCAPAKTSEFPKTAAQVNPIPKNGDASIGAERKPLAALASVYPAGMTEAQWAVAAGLKRKGGTWSTYVSRLRTAKRIEKRGDLFFATAQGFADLGSEVAQMPPPGFELVAFWEKKISGVGPMLRRLALHYPQVISREALAVELNMAASGGTFSTYISRLRTPGLIDVTKEGLRASDALMVGA